MKKRFGDPFMFFVVLMAIFWLFPSEEHKERVLTDPMFRRLQPQQAVKVDLSPKGEMVVVKFKIQYEEIYTGVKGTPIFCKGEIKFPDANLSQNGLPITCYFPSSTKIFFRSPEGVNYCLYVPVIPRLKVVALLKRVDSHRRMLVLAQAKREGRNKMFVFSKFATKTEIEDVSI